MELVIHNGKTGFTEQYANWIAKELGCKAVSSKNVTDVRWRQCDTIIYGGSLLAGQIRGLKKIKEKCMADKKRLIVYAVGSMPISMTDTIEKMKNENLTSEELKSIPFFYFQGGVNYEKMGFVPKIMLKAMYKSLKKKQNKTAEETGMMEALEKSFDKSDAAYVKPLIECVK